MKAAHLLGLIGVQSHVGTGPGLQRVGNNPVRRAAYSFERRSVARDSSSGR